MIHDPKITNERNRDLGHGWFANLRHEDGKEALTIRNPDKGQRIELKESSIALLRQIIKADEKLEQAIIAGSANADLDAALVPIQEILGVTDGGPAGQFFSDLEDGEWAKMTTACRTERLHAYVAHERLYQESF